MFNSTFGISIVCEESSIDVDNDWVVVNVYPMMKGKKKKTCKQPMGGSKQGGKCKYCKKSNHPKDMCFWNLNNIDNKLKEK